MAAGAQGDRSAREGLPMTWDEYGMSIARAVAAKSKDPSTRAGCALLDREGRVVSTGFNGLPRCVPDDAAILEHRETKLSLVLHAEENALLFARQSLDGCTAYVWPMPPCSRCAAKLAQAGIRRVVAPQPSGEQMARWGPSLELAAWVYRHAGIEFAQVDRDA
ncbi:dCMP deaminase family protein [Endozoicomonas sp. 4G]|uniref:dCMP deaminase family protein n=1 Tax=Endozoicomonas sp. 4G TaxID=2872754 RepID=UPI00320B0A48